MAVFHRNCFFILLLGSICIQIMDVNGAKILFYPLDTGFNSHAINLGKLATYLQDDGHNVSIIMNREILDRYNPDHLQIIKYDLPKDIKPVTDPDILAEVEIYMKDTWKSLGFMGFWGRVTSPFCDALLSHEGLVQKLKAEQYDLLFTDDANECSKILSDYLDVTTILYSNHAFRPNHIHYPRITSFVCDSIATHCSGDDMSFLERSTNLVYTMLFDHVFYPSMLSPYQEIREKHGMNSSIDIMNPVRFAKSIYIVNVDFVLDYPRPVMPHIFPISGLYKRDPDVLPTDLADKIDNSAYDSVVVVSFGTLLDKVPSNQAEIMAQVFGELPAIVIWRFTGTPPKSLAENTKLVGWFPQYDVLAHPKTKLFVTHCGASATFEAASLGIPVLAIPFFVDQRYHALQLVNRLKMGVMTDMPKGSEDEFQEKLLNVFNNQKFAKNAKKVSEMMNDRDVEPKQKFLHLVNYTIKYNGAEHLVSRPGRELSTLQFYSVDVVCFLLSIPILMVLILFFALRICRYILIFTKTKVKKN